MRSRIDNRRSTKNPQTRSNACHQRRRIASSTGLSTCPTISVRCSFSRENSLRVDAIAFLEHLVYDANGQLLAGNLADYLIPTATDFPRIRAIALENHGSPSNPLGVKGAGEGAIIPIGGLMANAVGNALASFGAMPNQLPLSPARVWHMGSAKHSTNVSDDRRPLRQPAHRRSYARGKISIRAD